MRFTPPLVHSDQASSLALGAPLPRTTARLKAGDPVRIVAVGSSSTIGLWVLSPDATYPEVLARLRPTTRINSGRIGETITGGIARFQRDVIAYSPDLVVWRLGTNDVAWGGRAVACRIGSRRACAC
jgi:acyl-CoA thioesterase-1